MLQVQSERVHEEAVVNGFFDACARFLFIQTELMCVVIRLSVVFVLISIQIANVNTSNTSNPEILPSLSPKISFKGTLFVHVTTFKHDTHALFTFIHNTQTHKHK